MAHWSRSAFFYHIYPLGYCGAPEANDLRSPPVPRLETITERLPAITALGANALYLGPLFESEAHGYDTVDWRHVDRRLGTDEDLGRLSAAAHALGMHIVLDGVFGHSGRAHPWFRELREAGPESPAARRYRGVSPCPQGTAGPGGETFNYECWGGHASLPRLDLSCPEVREELIGAVLSWIDRWDIDGLRLDAADTVDLGFQRELAARCRARKPGFWLMGEIIHGDYRTWAAPRAGGGDAATAAPLDSVTNYECWKGLWSSLVDANYHEIDYALRRQSGEGGIYRGIDLYNFVDNHDVDRAVSKLPDASLLYPLYGLLFTMPGIPSVYYGSEHGLPGRRSESSDSVLRPSAGEVEAFARSRNARSHNAPLAGAIARLARARSRITPLREGGYECLHVSPRQLAFLRRSPSGLALVALNASDAPVDLELRSPLLCGTYRDELAAEERPGGELFEAKGGRLVLRLHPRWLRILAPA